MELTIIKPAVNHVYNGNDEYVDLPTLNAADGKLQAIHTIIATASLAHKCSKSVRVLCPIF